MNLPDQMLLRAGVVCGYLGIDYRGLNAFVDAGLLHPIRLRRGVKGQRDGARFFRRVEVVEIAVGKDVAR